VTSATPPFDHFFIFSVHYTLPSIHLQNLRFVSSAVPEILEGPRIRNLGHVTRATPQFANFSFFGIVSLTTNLHTKYEVCIFIRSRDIRGVPKFEK